MIFNAFGAGTKEGKEKTTGSRQTQGPGEYTPSTETDGIYAIALAVLMVAMQNQQKIIEGRIAEIEMRNQEIGGLQDLISLAKSNASQIEKDGKVAVDPQLKEWIDNEIATNPDSPLRELPSTDELDRHGFDAVMNELQSKSEKLSSTNQMSQIKLQQNVSTFQILTQTASSLVENAKSAGGFITQKM